MDCRVDARQTHAPEAAGARQRASRSWHPTQIEGTWHEPAKMRALPVGRCVHGINTRTFLEHASPTAPTSAPPGCQTYRRNALFGNGVSGIGAVDGQTSGQKLGPFPINLGWEHHDRCRENMAHTRHSKPDSGPGFRMKVLNNFNVVVVVVLLLCSHHIAGGLELSPMQIDFGAWSHLWEKLTETAPIPCRKWRFAGEFGTLAALM